MPHGKSPSAADKYDGKARRAFMSAYESVYARTDDEGRAIAAGHSAAKRVAKHEGPGPHPGTGTPQTVHGNREKGQVFAGDKVKLKGSALGTTRTRTGRVLSVSGGGRFVEVDFGGEKRTVPPRILSLVSPGEGNPPKHQSARRSKPKAEPKLGLESKSISEIAGIIRRDWGSKVNFAARPYLDAMRSLDSISDNFGADSGRSVVAYFLSNASSWRGETAKEVKAHLKNLLKGNARKRARISMDRFTKLDPDRRMAFGWFSVVQKDGRPVVDLDGDLIEPADLENAVYEYVLDSRRGDAMHVHKGTARLVESIVFTPEKVKALDESISKMLGREYRSGLPVSGWWGGFKVDDEVVWKLLREGRMPMFSIGGRGSRIPLS